MSLAASDFQRVVALSAALDRTVADPERRAAFTSIVEGLGPLLEDPAALVQKLPEITATAMKPYGWAWNGIYALGADGKLHLASAWGPPVCSELEKSGGALTSGMCFDGIELNQTLAAYDAKAWPGYVSCDAESGLGTVAGIVSPLRDAAGAPLAVWDLDSVQPIDPGDVRFVDVLFATLARAVRFERAHFAL